MSDTYTNFAPLRYDQAALARQGYGVATSGPSDEQMNVGFYPHMVPVGKSAGGQPIYKSIDHIKISHPGEGNLQVTDRPVTEEDTIRFARRWAQYRAGREQIPDGIPLDLLFPIHPHIARTLRGHGVHTVEQLAKLSGQGLSAIGMGAQEWVNAAARYLEHAEKGVGFHKFETEIKAKNKEISALKKQMADLTAIVQNMSQRPQSAPQNYDYQTAQINAVHQSANEDTAYLQAPAQFVQDLSGSMEPSKRRGWPKGKPRKAKESNDGQ